MTGEPTPCVVQVDGLEPAMLAEIVTAALARTPGVEVHVGPVAPGGPRADLVVTGGEGTPDRPAVVLSVAPDGTARQEVPLGQLSHGVLAAAVNAARQREAETTWLGPLAVACRRADELLDEATGLAAAVYGADGTFADWRSELARHRLEAEARLAPSLAVPSRPADDLVAELDDEPSAGPAPGSAAPRLAGARPWPHRHPFSRLIVGYSLDGRQVDLLLLAAMTELDPRYGHRFAYLQRDVALTVPTVDLAAALLGQDAAERLAVQRELIGGTLTRYGLVALGDPGQPHHGRTIHLDPGVLRMLLGDTGADEHQLLIDPAATARTDQSYLASTAAVTAAACLAERRPVHLWGATPAERRSAALDVAHLTGERLLVVAVDELGTGPGPVHHLHRECLRLAARALIEDVAPASDGRPDPYTPLADLAITAGIERGRPRDLALGARRHNVEVRPAALESRLRWWQVASRWTGHEVEGGGLGEVAGRYGVTVDRAAAALQAAAGGRAGAAVTLDEVIGALSDATADDAGGLLTTTHPRVRLDDLVLPEATRAELDHAVTRIRHRDLVISEGGWDQRSSRLTGTYLLFAGPPGTGKTMAGEAVAGELGLPVLHLEISSLLSRWVGEFEGAVDKVFAAAASSGAILLANEADAILSPRTAVDSAQAHYANAGTAHLLSRLEAFTGHVIFTSNLVGATNIDPAFHRRLTATIRFLLPDAERRRDLWRAVWPTATRDGRPVDYTFDRHDLLDRLAEEQAISGGSIANIARTATFLAAADGDRGPGAGIHITEDHLQRALRLELAKIGDFRLLLSARPRRAVAAGGSGPAAGLAGRRP